MLKRHVDQIWARLDELYANGATFISRGELYHWYGVERINKTPWRDLKARWDDLLEEKNEKPCDPHVAEVRGGISLFFSRDPKSLGDLAA
ncbi:MAG TPA: hypothetical protein VHZ24_04340 [Pirellulales bacterium]|jgi:hypothetical protein|nr:hypothetical protein [Pirellulales bacterium]